MKRLFSLVFPDITNLSKKDSDISTKRYADLRIINHFISMSWVSLAAIIYYKQWEHVSFHIGTVGMFAFLRGALALDGVKNLFSKIPPQNPDKKPE